MPHKPASPAFPIRPFAWAELEPEEPAPRRPEQAPEPGAAGAAVRSFRWTELDGDGPAAPGAGAAAQGDPQTRALAAARQEAEALLAKAREEAQRLRDAARAEGLEAGRAQGRKELQDAAGALARVAKELAGFKEGFFRDARGQVVELALALVNRLLGPLAEGDEEAVVRVVERALQLLSDRETLTIRVNPQDLRSLVEAKPHLLESFDGIQKLTVLEDPAVKRGGCLVQSPTSEIDARLDTQFAELARALRSPG